MSKKRISIISGSIFLIIAFILILFPVQLTNFDMTITNTVYNSFPATNQLIAIITAFGNTSTVVIMVALVTIYLLIKKNYYSAIFLVFDSCLIASINKLIKTFVARPRPSVNHLVVANGYSFPSGHSASTMAFFLSLVFIICVLSTKKKTWLKLILLVIPFIIAFTRVYLGVHYFSDVIAGLSYSMAITILVGSFYQSYVNNLIE